MNRYKIAMIALLSLAFLWLRLQSEQEKIKEYVQVVNVEVAVRVMHKGNAVAGLKKSDFLLYENGKRKEINGFSVFRRLMGRTEAPPTVQSESVTGKESEPRLFVLYFYIFEKEVNYNDALDYFFKSIYRKNDRVLIATHGGVYAIQRPEDIQECRRLLDAAVNAYADRLAGMYQRFRNLVFNGPFSAEGSKALVGEFTSSVYINTDAFRRFAESLKQIKMEKWVLLFSQREIAVIKKLSYAIYKINSDYGFGRMDTDQRSHPVDAIHLTDLYVNEIIRNCQNHRPDILFNAREIEEIFIQANATFHMLTLGSQTKEKYSTDAHQFEELGTGWQDVFAAISKVTGGENLENMDMQRAVERFADREDIQYVLTYAPERNVRGQREIKVKVKGSVGDLYYSRSIDLRPVGELDLSDFAWSEPNVRFTLRNYRMDLQREGVRGQIGLMIEAIPEKGDTLEFLKELSLPETESELSMKLNLPKAGKYRLRITVVDMLSEKDFTWEKNIIWTGQTGTENTKLPN